MTETHDPVAIPRNDPFAPEGEPCANCAAPLARDQRYCLTCGVRRTGFAPVLSGLRSDPSAHPSHASVSPAVATTPGVGSDPAPRWLDSGVAGGVACLLLALLVGVLIGRAGDETPQSAAAPSVVTVSGTGAAAGAGGAADAAPVTFTSDWPEGKKGFTVQLQTLPKEGTDAAAVAAAKQAAVTKGASGAGALDSDEYGTLDPGAYVIFSGQFADRSAARKELAARKSAFPEAKVVEVASDDQAAPASTKGVGAEKTKEPSKAEQAEGAKAIQDLEKASPEDYQKKSAKLPKTIVTPGKPPPKDSKPAGGGSESETFE